MRKIACYRIIVPGLGLPFYPDLVDGLPDPRLFVRGPRIRGYRLFVEDEEITHELVPRFPRARFWFTEAGWKRFGARIAARARSEGFPVKVIKREIPASAIVYEDKWQVAALPSGG